MWNLLSTVQFPSGSGVQGIVFSVLSWIYSFIPNYAVAIIFFCFLLRLTFLPIDFGTKYFQKKNQLAMAKIKPELDELGDRYKDDPMGMMRARQGLMRKHGSNTGGLCLFTLLNLVVVILVFFSVFQALNGIGNHNIRHQQRELHAVYVTHADARLAARADNIHGWTIADLDLSDDYFQGNRYDFFEMLDEIHDDLYEYEYFRAAIWQTYRDTSTGFLWIRNLWRSDVPWVSPVASTHATEGHTLVYSIISPQERNWNGLLFLVILAGAITFLSIWLNMKIMSKKKIAEEDDKPKEEVVTYSVRKALYDDKSQPSRPQMDPAQMGKMMKIIMPMIMVVFALMMTSALAVYIIFSSLFTTLFTLAKNPIINKLIDMGDKRRKVTVEDDPNKINPHAKFFKTKRK